MQFLEDDARADLARRKSPGAGSVPQRSSRAPAVTNGHRRFRESQVAGRAAHVAGMMQVSDSACGPTVEKGVRRPRSRKRAPMSPPDRQVYIDERGGTKAPPNH